MGAPEIIILIVLFLILSVIFFFGRKALIWLSRYLKKLDGLQDSIDDLNRKICYIHSVISDINLRKKAKKCIKELYNGVCDAGVRLESGDFDEFIVQTYVERKMNDKKFVSEVVNMIKSILNRV